MGEAEALRSRPRPRPRILVSEVMEYWSIGVLEWRRFCRQVSGRFFVPKGLDEGSQAIYCLGYVQKRATVP